MPNLISMCSYYLSVYLYGFAAQEEYRKTVPQIREGEYEGLAKKVSAMGYHDTMRTLQKLVLLFVSRQVEHWVISTEVDKGTSCTKH